MHEQHRIIYFCIIYMLAANEGVNNFPTVTTRPRIEPLIPDRKPRRYNDGATTPALYKGISQ